MPHDIEGRLINPGDTVTVEFTVTAVQEGEDYCNLNLQTVEPMKPGEYKVGLTLNGAQVRLKGFISGPQDLKVISADIPS
jgi:hypothetical protein